MQVHHDILQLAIHAVFEVTEKVVDPEAAVTFWFDGVTDSVLLGFAAVNEPTIPMDACGVQT